MNGIEAAGPNAKQIEYWNGPVGERWLELADGQEPRLSPFGDAALEALGARPGETVLDIGCGSGFTALELARHVGPQGRVVGIDVSGIMLDDACGRAEAAGHANIEFLHVDAAAHAFERGLFDRAYSRFGVMFFAEPEAAFANIRTGMKPGGRLAFAAWQTMEANPWSYLTVQVATRHVPRHNPAGPEDPGPYAFGDPARVERILGAAGFVDIEISPHVVPLDFGPDIETAVGRLTEVGPMATPIRRAPEDVRIRVLADLADAIQDRLGPNGVTFNGAAWIVTAENPG